MNEFVNPWNEFKLLISPRIENEIKKQNEIRNSTEFDSIMDRSWDRTQRTSRTKFNLPTVKIQLRSNSGINSILV